MSSNRFPTVAALTFGLTLGPVAYAGDDVTEHLKKSRPGLPLGHGSAFRSWEMHGRVPGSLTIDEQKTCPVCAKPIDKDFSVTHEDLQVYFSSEECLEAFKKTPERFLVDVYLQVYPQQAQVRCPVTGNPIDAQVFTEFKGRRIYYCCAGCDRRFKADPARYTAALAKSYTRQVHCPMTGDLVRPGAILSPTSRVLLCCTGCVSKFWRADADELQNAGEINAEAGLLAHGLTMEDDLFVSLPEGQVLERGRGQPVVHLRVRYLLSDPSHAEAFKARPDRYVEILRNRMIELIGGKHPLYSCREHPGIVQIGPGACPVNGNDLVPIRSGGQSATLETEARRLQSSSASK